MLVYTKGYTNVIHIFFIYALLIAVGVFNVYMLEYFYCAVIRHQPPNVSTTRHLRQYVVNEIISNYPDAKKICELGSGFGGLARVIARNTKADVYALENMPFAAFVSKIIDILSGCKKNHTIWTDVFEYLKNEHFDVVVAYLSSTVTPKIYEHTEKLYKLCKKYALHVRFLSCFTPDSETEFERVTQDKRDWIHRYIDLDISDSDIIVVRCKKHKYSINSGLLIDDNPKNIKLWRTHNGIGIIFKNLNNCAYQLESLNFRKKPCKSTLFHTVLQKQR